MRRTRDPLRAQTPCDDNDRATGPRARATPGPIARMGVRRSTDMTRAWTPGWPPDRSAAVDRRVESSRIEDESQRDEGSSRAAPIPRERSNSADPVQRIRFREFRAFTGRGRSDESTRAQAGPVTSPALVPWAGGSLRVHASDDLQHAVRAKYCPPSLSCMSMRSMTTRTSFEAYSVGLDGKWHHVKQRVPTFFPCDISGPSEDAPKAAWAASPRNEKHWAMTHPSA